MAEIIIISDIEIPIIQQEYWLIRKVHLSDHDFELLSYNGLDEHSHLCSGLWFCFCDIKSNRTIVPEVLTSPKVRCNVNRAALLKQSWWVQMHGGAGSRRSHYGTHSIRFESRPDPGYRLFYKLFQNAAPPFGNAHEHCSGMVLPKGSGFYGDGKPKSWLTFSSLHKTCFLPELTNSLVSNITYHVYQWSVFVGMSSGEYVIFGNKTETFVFGNFLDGP